MAIALENLKIVSFEWIVVGPLATSYLGDLGATVIKVESHVRPDGARFIGPIDGEPNDGDHSLFFSHHNTSKYSVTINIKKPAGKNLILKVVEWADVLIENMSPGTMKNLGLSYDDVAAVNPRIIYLSLSIQGQFGPHYRSTGFGHSAAALSGCTHLSGWPDRGPSPCHGAYSDYITARIVPSLILSALDYRQRTGEGQYIDNSILENMAFFFSLPVMDYVSNGRIANRNGNRYPSACPHGVFRCKGTDRWIAIAVFSELAWQSFCQVLGKSDWLQNPKYANISERKKNEDELENQIEIWTKRHDAEKIEVLMQNAGVPANLVESTSDLFHDPQLKHRNAFRVLEHGVMGPIIHLGPASKYSEITHVQTAAPLMGEHNSYVFKELFGLSDNDIADLYSEGIITTEADIPF